MNPPRTREAPALPSVHTHIPAGRRPRKLRLCQCYRTPRLAWDSGHVQPLHLIPWPPGSLPSGAQAQLISCLISQRWARTHERCLRARNTFREGRITCPEKAAQGVAAPWKE